jgi:hypothetical protein
MNLVLDPHLHLYPCYKDNFFHSLYKNLNHLARNTKNQVLGGILTERDDCRVYQSLLESSVQTLRQYKIELIANKGTHLELNLDSKVLVIYPGIQAQSRERIEVLGLFTTKFQGKNLPLIELIQSIKESNGLPVINWAPGKWSSVRGNIIRDYLDAHSANLLLGISKILPKGFSLPNIIKENNLPFIVGSDPLPVKGDEKVAGTIGIEFKDLESLSSDEIGKKLLENNFSKLGAFNSLPQAFIRLLKNEISRRL